MPETLLAAYDEVDITPPLGGSMPGYFRDRQATGVLDPLKAKVLYLAQGMTSIALVACDLIGVPGPLVRRIRDATTKACRTPPRFVFVHGTHTHTGGMVPRAGTYTSDAETIYPGFYAGQVDEKWVQRLVDGIANTIRQAIGRAREEKRLTLHTGRETTVAHYRRYQMKDGTVRTNPGRNNPNVVRPAGQIDPRLHVLRFEAAKIVAVIFGMHPDCVSGTRYSADYPHHLTETIRQALGNDWRVIFLNACCGNINHIDLNNAKQRSGPDEARRIGERLGVVAVGTLQQGQPVALEPLRAATREVTCRLRRPTAEDLKQAEELLRNPNDPKRNPLGFNELYAPAALVLARTKDREQRAEIAALRLGSFGLAFMPGEIFVELGREVEEASPWRPTRTIGLTNGALGYIPTRRGYAEGGYEAGYRSARYEPDTGHRWAQTAAELLKEMGK
jgi:neutral ceramidase